MTRSALALLSALVALPTLAHAQESPPATSELYDALAHAPFCEADATFEPRLAMRLGFIELGRHDLIEPTLQCLFDLRAAHPTGENGEVIGPALAALLAEDPGVFLAIATEHPREFDEWLGQLDHEVFTWEGEPPNPLESRRQSLIAVVSSTQVSVELEPMRQRTIAGLRAARVRQID